MPLYEYACRGCDHRFEVLQRMGEGGEGLACPRCGHPEVVKRFSTFAGAVAGGSKGEASAGAGPSCACGAPRGFS
jgi:putative FmdB family regulatory protein